MSYLPAPAFKNLPLGAVRPTGWILTQLRRDLAEGFAGRLDALTPHASTDLFTHRIEASSDQVAWWDSETRGNWLWGYTMMAYLADLPEHQARVTALLKDLKDSQDDDGYLGIYSPRSRYPHDGSENGELWAQGRALLAMLAYFELTGNPTYLQAVQAAADLTLKQYGPGRPYFGRVPRRDDLTGLTHGLCYVDVVEWLYALTGETRYREFGVWLYEDFCQMPLPFTHDDLALGNVLNPFLELHGHAVHTVEHWRALLWAHQMGSRPEYAQAVQNALHKLRHSALPSGAILGDESLHGLPTPDIGYEYCTLTEMLFSLTSALQKSGDGAFGDWSENIVFNAGQGARFANGRGLSYLTSDTRTAATASRPDSYSNLRGRHGRFKYSPTHEDVACCCNPNAVRFMPHYISRMWMGLSGQPGLAAVAYGPCTLTTEINHVRVTITEETDYPFTDTIRFTLWPERPVDFALHLRQPAWAEAVEIVGAPARAEGGYQVIEKTWAPADTLAVTFKTSVRLTPYPTGEVAVHRGALQFVWPIAHALQPIKDYPLESFHDYDLTPQDLGQAYPRLLLDEAQPNYGLTFETDPAADMSRCWEQAPVHLTAGAARLVPLGCTPLRQAAFPIQRRASSKEK
jgi:uncharacterized protein